MLKLALSTLLAAGLLLGSAGQPSAAPQTDGARLEPEAAVPARFDPTTAQRLKRRLQPKDPAALRADLDAALARGDRAEAASAAAQLCSQGVPGSCAKAERTAGNLSPRLLLLEARQRRASLIIGGK